MSRRVYVHPGDGVDGHYVQFGSWLPKLLGTDGTTVSPHTIRVAGVFMSAPLHAHEYCHVLQVKRHGRVMFLARYLVEWAYRMGQQLLRGNVRSTFKRAHDAHSMEQAADIFARLRVQDFRAVEAPER